MRIKKKDLLQLELISTILRDDIITMIHEANSGHPGGSLSIADIICCLYFGKDRYGENILRYNPEYPDWENRDRVILSKGHAAPALYSALGEAGFFNKKWFSELRRIDSILQGHPDMHKTPGIDFSTGSLGQGSSVGCGIAYAAKLQNKDFKVYVIAGDGELQEGSNWEAFSIAGHNKLDNFCLIIDSNKLQIDGSVFDLNDIEPLEMKFKSFGFATRRIDGHNYREIINALDHFKNCRKSNRPFVIIADTIKGKGVASIEGNVDYHGKPIKGQIYTEAKKYFKKKSEKLSRLLSCKKSNSQIKVIYETIKLKGLELMLKTWD